MRLRKSACVRQTFSIIWNVWKGEGNFQVARRFGNRNKIMSEVQGQRELFQPCVPGSSVSCGVPPDHSGKSHLCRSKARLFRSLGSGFRSGISQQSVCKIVQDLIASWKSSYQHSLSGDCFIYRGQIRNPQERRRHKGLRIKKLRS